MHHSCDGKTVLGLLIGNRMPACNDSSCLCDDIRASLQNLAENGIIQVIGPGNQVNCHQNLTSHRIYIAQCVGSGNRSKYIWVIDDRWKEIRCTDDGLCIVHTIHSRVIGSIDADQKLCWNSLYCQWTQNLRQGPGAHFRRSTSATGKRCQANLPACSHKYSS